MNPRHILGSSAPKQLLTWELLPSHPPGWTATLSLLWPLTHPQSFSSFLLYFSTTFSKKSFLLWLLHGLSQNYIWNTTCVIVFLLSLPLHQTSLYCFLGNSFFLCNNFWCLFTVRGYKFHENWKCVYLFCCILNTSPRYTVGIK